MDSQSDIIEIDADDTPASQDKDSNSPEKQDPGLSGTVTPQQQQQDQAAGSSDVNQAGSNQVSGPSRPAQARQTFIGGFPIDVPFEASKLPLDVAIYNSARSAGGDDRIRKYLQAVLIVGGGALMSGMVHALESRFVNSFRGASCCISRFRLVHRTMPHD